MPRETIHVAYGAVGKPTKLSFVLGTKDMGQDLQHSGGNSTAAKESRQKMRRTNKTHGTVEGLDSLDSRVVLLEVDKAEAAALALSTLLLALLSFLRCHLNLAARDSTVLLKLLAEFGVIPRLRQAFDVQVGPVRLSSAVVTADKVADVHLETASHIQNPSTVR